MLLLNKIIVIVLLNLYFVTRFLTGEHNLSLLFVFVVAVVVVNLFISIISQTVITTIEYTSLTTLHSDVTCHHKD